MKDSLYRIFSHLVSETNLKRELEYGSVYQYLDKYMKDIGKFSDEASLESNQNVRLNRTIWTCWQQGMENAPKMVRICHESVVRNKPEDFQIILLTDGNLDQYVKLPGYIEEKYHKGIISRAHYADLIRLELLYRYGGCWVDATVYVSGRIPREYLSGELFVFKGAQTSFLRISNWWMYSERGNPLVRDLRDLMLLFWKKENSVRNYFIFHIMFSKLIDTNSFHRAMYISIPYYTNVYQHMLQGEMNKAYSEKRWNEICAKTTVHKLTYKRHYLQGDLYNFYMALMEGKLV